MSRCVRTHIYKGAHIAYSIKIDWEGPYRPITPHNRTPLMERDMPKSNAVDNEIADAMNRARDSI
ncbi:hypothetical protein PhaeoP71_01867 [Phaeobacter piscinae]|nr:hypothetical protein PhaeoP71_01867 [Phaeobacter piscinae]